jgi:hypothetical protein
MSPRRSSRLVGTFAALLIATGLGAAPAAAANPKAKPAAAAPGKKLPGKVTFRDAPSSEKPADRARRLKRECKGRPNAGMCLGHAS